MVFECKTAHLGPELHVPVGSRPHLWFFGFQTAFLASGSKGPSPHLWFLNAKQRVYDQNYKSLWVPALICGFYMRNSDFRTTITSLYWSQTSPVISCIQKNSVISTRIAGLHRSQPTTVALCIQNNDFITRITSLYGPQPSSVVWCIQNGEFSPKLQVSIGPIPRLSFCACKTAWLTPE